MILIHGNADQDIVFATLASKQLTLGRPYHPKGILSRRILVQNIADSKTLSLTYSRCHYCRLIKNNESFIMISSILDFALF